MNKHYNNNNILAYSCLHFPYHHKDAIDFLRDVSVYYKPDRVVDLGDTLDQYALSRYPKSPNALSAVDEMKKARKCVKELGTLFPKVEVMKSNHCERLYSKATISGIPREFIKPYKELIEAPEGWKWHNNLTLTVDKTREKIYFAHEGGQNSLNFAKNIAMNTVLGHIHSSLSVQFFSNPLKEMFACHAGCLCSDKGYAFAYNKATTFRPVLGCIIITDGVPIAIKM